MNKERYLDFIQLNDDRISKHKGLADVHGYKENMIRNELKRVRCSIEKRHSQGVSWVLSTCMNHLVEGLHVNDAQFKNIKKLIHSDRKAKIIFIPVYKSYLDPIIMHYIHHLQDIELGFTFGNYEDSPKIRFVDGFLKTTGTFLIRRDP